MERKSIVVGTMFRETELLDDLEKNSKLHPLELAKQAGFRVVVLDCEHKAFNEERIANYAKVAHGIGVSLWLRPRQQEEEVISKYADIGVTGFMIPNAIDLPRVQKVINQAFFDPIADPRAHIRRGYSIGELLLDLQDLGNKIGKEIEYVNRNTVVVVQTEHPKGIDRLAKILAIKGITGTIIGPNDLAINLSRLKGNEPLLELEVNRMYEQEVMLQAYERIGKIAVDSEKVAGIHFTSRDQAGLIKRLIEDKRFHNYRLILFGTERNLLEEKDYTAGLVEEFK